MIRVILITAIMLSCTILFALVPADFGDMDYNKMVIESKKMQSKTPEEIEQMRAAYLEVKNARVKRTMQSLARPRFSSKLKTDDSKQATEKDGQDLKAFNGGTIIALIVLILGVFMLLYVYSKFERNKVG